MEQAAQLALRDINRRLSRLNHLAVLGTACNILIVLSGAGVFFLLESFMDIVARDQLLLGLVVVTLVSLSLSAVVIFALVKREILVRTGRILFEYAGEYAQKVDLSDLSQDAMKLEERMLSYLEIRLFAVNETLPLFASVSPLGPFVYITLNTMVTVASFGFLHDALLRMRLGVT